MRETVFPILSSDELVPLAVQQQESTVTVGVCLAAGACFHHAPAHRTVKTLDPCVQILLLMPQTEIAKTIVNATLKSCEKIVNATLNTHEKDCKFKSSSKSFGLEGHRNYEDDRKCYHEIT